MWEKDNGKNDVKNALALMADEPVNETLSQETMQKYRLKPIMWALNNIHFPESEFAIEEARRRLSFDELLNLQLGMSMMKLNSRESKAFKMNSDISINEFLEKLPFELTKSQKNAVDEIISDLCRNIPMNRLLQGDVGSGKTAAAAAACFFTARNGCQSALMAPTEILASQHYKTLSEFLEPMGIKICLLTGSLTPNKKTQLKEKIANGEFDVIVGTHAIIQKDVVYNSLNLVITDEQHRFGVEQRTAFAEKGNFPHRLVMSATPIPRTLALIIYGDLDISIISEMPSGRKPVKTYAVGNGMRERAFNFVRERLDEGRQAYVICPLIEESESELNSVKKYAEDAGEKNLKGYSIGLLHGKMKAGEKEKIMKQFREGEIQVLISTTVVEVGVDVPNSAVMVIENAERFGLSQLHQLRGRVGRGKYESYCILIASSKTDECMKRMKIMTTVSDGFQISEEDLKMRGPGNFFGNAQHGLPPLKIADIACNSELMAMAQEYAEEILSVDPRLEKPQNHALKLNVMKLFEKSFSG